MVGFSNAERGEPKGFDRAEKSKDTYEDVADEYSSKEQAHAAAALVEIAATYKKIDRALAGQAKTMLREMINSGGDLDLEAVRALTDEAKRRYRAADAAAARNQQPAVDETTFYRVPTQERRPDATKREPTAEEANAAAWEDYRARLVASGALSEDGDLRVSAHELGLDDAQVKHLQKLQMDVYMSGPNPNVRIIPPLQADNGPHAGA